MSRLDYLLHYLIESQYTGVCIHEGIFFSAVLLLSVFNAICCGNCLRPKENRLLLSVQTYALESHIKVKV